MHLHVHLIPRYEGDVYNPKGGVRDIIPSKQNYQEVNIERFYNKLVRDNIPKIIESNGEKPIIRILNDDEYKIELEKKLKEEYQEVLNATGKDRIEELADMIEVIKSLAKLENTTLDDVITIANAKNSKRGAFNDKIFLEKVIENSKQQNI